MMKYIFADLDGTLLDNAKHISKPTLELIQRLREEKDVRFGIASGRAFTSLLPLLRSSQAERYVDVIVANNGAQIMDMQSGQIKRQPFVSKAQVKAILRAFAKEEGVTVCFHNPNRVLANRHTPRVERVRRINQAEEVALLPKADFTAPPRVMLLLERPEDETLLNRLRAYRFAGLKAYHSDRDVYEFLRTETSKANAIEWYVRRQGGQMKDVVVFGDSDNDVEMLRRCGWGVAMKNANAAAKEAADATTRRTNEEDGIYDYLKEHLRLFA